MVYSAIISWFTHIYGYYTLFDFILPYIGYIDTFKKNKGNSCVSLNQQIFISHDGSEWYFGVFANSCLCVLTQWQFPPPCDIRQLNLSKEQQSQLRSLRAEHRQILDRVGKQNRSLERSRRQNIIRILSSASFDETQASRYVADHYQAKSRFAVEELGVQHKIYRLLTPEQQKIWLETCVR